MPEEQTTSGEPVCGNCGYRLTGLTESSKCPECGRPLVEVLLRGGAWGKRYRSETTWRGRPLVAVALGPAPGERIGHARGIIAIGDQATGWLAIGGRARGIVAIGGMAIGLFSFGGLSLGLVSSMGGLAIGGMVWGGAAVGVLASGGVAIGYVASGGLAMGYVATGGGPFGVHTLGPGRSDQVAIDTLQRLRWFFGGSNVGVMTMIMPALACSAMNITAGALVGLLALARHFVSGRADSEESTFRPPPENR